MNLPDPRIKVALLTNTIAPARIPIYTGLAAQFDLLVLHGGPEKNRDSWHAIEKQLTNAKVKKAWGWVIRLAKRENGRILDYQYIHIRPGYAWHLLLFRPEAVITNEMGLRTLTALVYGTLFRKPVWVWCGSTLHSERNIGPARRLLRVVIAKWARQWISYGQTTTEYLLSLGIKRDDILQIQNAVDERRFSRGTTATFEIQPRPVLLHVGQFIPRKGIDLLLRAAATLEKEGREFSLLLVGSGPDKASLRQLSEELQLKNVYFEHSQVPEKMQSVYRSGDVLIFPTLEDVWGLVANEAMLAGLPVLCSKYAGCAPELFPPANIFDPRNPHEFTTKLREAVAGALPKPDLSRLKTTPQIVNSMVSAIENSARRESGLPQTASDEKPSGHS